MSNLILPRRTVRTSQPQHPARIDWSNPITRGLVDAWLPQSMAVTSVLGRKPTSTAPLSFVQTSHGVGASATSGSIHYDVDEWAESGPHSCLIIADILSFSGPKSFARKYGAISPAQIANSTLRGVPWSPANGLDYYSSPSAPKHGVYVANRPSLSNYDNWFDGVKASSTTALTEYGSTSNPLCFLGTEYNGELVTSSVGRMFLGAIWSRGLTGEEIYSLSANPWQIFAPRETRLFVPVGGGGSVNATASGAFPSVSLSANTAGASGSASASGSLAAITISAPTATASAGGSATASGSFAAISISPATATATATKSATASGAFAAISLSAPTATATGTTAGGANATCTPAQITISHATAIAIGSAVASGGYQSIGITAPTGSASVGNGNATASGALSAISITAPAAYASSGFIRAPSGSGPIVIRPTTVRPSNTAGRRY